MGGEFGEGEAEEADCDCGGAEEVGSDWGVGHAELVL